MSNQNLLRRETLSFRGTAFQRHGLSEGAYDRMNDVFSSSIHRAMARQLEMPDLFAVADKLVALGDAPRALTLYQTWLEHNADNPFVPAVLFNQGVILFNGGHIAVAKDVWHETTRVNPAFFPAYLNLGSALEQLGETTEAVAWWQRLVDRLDALLASEGLDDEHQTYRTDALQRIDHAKMRTAGELQQALEALYSLFDVLQRQDQEAHPTPAWDPKAIRTAQILAARMEKIHAFFPGA